MSPWRLLIEKLISLEACIFPSPNRTLIHHVNVRWETTVLMKVSSTATAGS
jgi:hypothetical protein